MPLSIGQLTVGVDTLRCLALATVDEPLPPSKMDLEAPGKFAEYEVCSSFSHVIQGYAVENDEAVDSPSLAISEIPTCQADYHCFPYKTAFCVQMTMSYLTVLCKSNDSEFR